MKPSIFLDLQAGGKRSGRGFTLIEVLVAASLMGILFVASYSLFDRSSRTYSQSLLHMQVRRDTEKLLEFLSRLLSWCGHEFSVEEHEAAPQLKKRYFEYYKQKKITEYLNNCWNSGTSAPPLQVFKFTYDDETAEGRITRTVQGILKGSQLTIQTEDSADGTGNGGLNFQFRGLEKLVFAHKNNENSLGEPDMWSSLEIFVQFRLPESGNYSPTKKVVRYQGKTVITLAVPSRMVKYF